MPLERVSLRAFLGSAKLALRNYNANQQSKPFTFVVGNQAADLDSLCSAIVLAYLRTYASTSSSKRLYIPLSNIPRDDLALRPELVPVLSRANLEPNDLITLTDLPGLQSQRIIPTNKTKWILVDHNALLGELGMFYGDRVAGCIDHHDEEGTVPEDCGDEPRVVKKSGSCSSLVVEYCREAWDALAAKSSNAETMKWNAELARVALGPILIDTSNLENEAKTTDIDVEAAKYLEKWITAAESEKFKAKEYYKEIWTAERDVDGMSLYDLLRKDYKQWSEKKVNLGVSSVVKNMDFLVEKAGNEKEFFNTIKQFSEENDLSICSVMTRASTKDGGFKRELFIWGLDEQGVKAAKDFEAESGEKLGLGTWKDGALDSDGESKWRKCWVQKKIENSRKQVAPLLRSSMTD